MAKRDDDQSLAERERERRFRTEPGDIGPAARIQAFAELRALTPPGKRRAADAAALDRDGTLKPPDPDHYATMRRRWRERVIEYRSGLTPKTKQRGIRPMPPPPPPATSWIPIGPSVVRRGQAAGAPAVSGRAVDIAIASGGTRSYLATANGGVWRSDDGGTSWRSLNDSFDLDPTTLNVDSQACGAIAIDPAAPDRVYVGTGEGDASAFFGGVFGVQFSYEGVGPLRSDDGGTTWVNEAIAPGSPTLNGQAFYELAVDPVRPRARGCRNHGRDLSAGAGWIRRAPLAADAGGELLEREGGAIGRGHNLVCCVRRRASLQFSRRCHLDFAGNTGLGPSQSCRQALRPIDPLRILGGGSPSIQRRYLERRLRGACARPVELHDVGRCRPIGRYASLFRRREHGARNCLGIGILVFNGGDKHRSRRASRHPPFGCSG